MQYHLLKVSRTRNLRISNSQGKSPNEANFNFASFPGAKVELIKFHRANHRPFETRQRVCCNVKTISSLISDFANLLLNKTERVFVHGIHLRHSEPHRAKEIIFYWHHVKKAGSVEEFPDK